MIWQQVDKYHLRSGAYTISKAFVVSGHNYQAWHQKDLISTHRDVESAKAAAERHEAHTTAE